MKIIELNSDELKKIMNGEDSELKEAILNHIKKETYGDAYDGVKKWLENFDDADKLDQLLVMFFADLLNRIGNGINEELDRLEKKGKKNISSMEVMDFSISKFREFADNLEEVNEKMKKELTE